MRDRALVLEGDGAVSCLDSLSERRALFGRGQLSLFKIQAGVVVPAPRTDWSVQLSPGSARLSGRVFECIDVAQSLDLTPAGYTRRVRVSNSGSSLITLRLLTMSDPAAAQFRPGRSQWGSLGLEAFGREGHVAMDEISATPRVRVIGSHPSPSKFYMTTDKSRAAELLREGVLPEQTAGMSGQVLVLSVHEFELAPSESKEVLFASLYSDAGADEALKAFEMLKEVGASPSNGREMLACSSPRVSEAFMWAAAAVRSAPFEGDLLDRVESMPGLEYVCPSEAESSLARVSALVARGGLVGHASDPSKPGVLETSLFISALSRHLALSADRKAARRPYALLKKMAKGIDGLSKGGAIRLDPTLPQGWRRSVLTGYPAGEVPEVSLAVGRAFHDLSQVSVLLGKEEEAAVFRERSEIIAEGVAKRLRDAASDRSGKAGQDDTIDTAVACYRNPSLRSVASAAVHRLLEDDFETDYGPRTVPVSNRKYFSESYGQGQLGGYWTRAALSMACLAYAAALPGVGSLLLEKASRLATDDALGLKGVPGQFPYWVDVKQREAHGDRSDPVAASRLIQAVVEGELGFRPTRGAPSFDPPALSTVNWVLARDIHVGDRSTVFVGRGGGMAVAFAKCGRATVRAGHPFDSCDDLKTAPPGVHGITFYGPGQVVCVGNSSAAPLKARVSFPARAPGFARKLSTALEEYDPGQGTWNKLGSLRVSPQMSFDAPLGPGGWKAYRVSND